MHDPWHKLIPPGAGFLGAVLMMSYLGAMPTRIWVVALASGPVMAYFGTDVAVSYLVSIFPWLPTSDAAMVKLSGLIGCAIGLASIHLVGAFAATGRRFNADPFDPRDTK